jgi:hypothetical protein
LKYKDELILKLKVLFAGSVIVTVNSFNLTLLAFSVVILKFSIRVSCDVSCWGTAVPTGNAWNLKVVWFEIVNVSKHYKK